MRWSIALTILGVVSRVSVAGAATEVSTCGQSFAGSGFLSADLDCTGFPTAAVVINGGGLDLRGFTLTGGNASAIFCSKSCSVVSEPAGGQIVNAGEYGIDGDRGDATPGRASVSVNDVVIDGNTAGGIDAVGNITVTNTAVQNSPLGDGLNGIRVKVMNSTIDNVGRAVRGEPVKIQSSQVSNCTSMESELGACVFHGDKTLLIRDSTVTGAAVEGVFVGLGRARVRDSFITGNGGDGVRGNFPVGIRIDNSDITGNGGNGVSGGGKTLLIKDNSSISGNTLDGILWTDQIMIVDSAATANGRSGIDTDSMFTDCGPVRVVRSTVTGNGTDLATCGVSESCADLATCSEPADLVDGSVCDTSYDSESGFPGTSWGICSAD